MFDIYIQKMNAVEYVTAQAYAKMISEFVMFSPGIDPNDLELFIISKFNILKSGGSLILNLIGTPLKYYRWIGGFLKRVFCSSYSVLNPEYSQLIKEDYESNVNSITLSDVMNAYIELMDLKKSDDALIIHFMYSLLINPETISLLTFDSINDEDNMKYFDTKTLSYVNTKLNENLMRDILFL